MTKIESFNDVEIENDFRRMADNALHQSAVRTAETERKITLSLLRHLNEIERRHLYSKFSVSSLHGYCVKELRMDEGTAGRRVSAARLLRDLPAIEEKVLSGAVKLTSVAQAGIFFRRESKSGNDYSLDQKRDLILELEDKSTREVDRILIAKSDQPEIHFRETTIVKTASMTEIKLYLDDETMAALHRLKEVWSHALPGASFGDIVKRAAIELVSKNDLSMTKKPRTQALPKTGAETSAQKSEEIADPVKKCSMTKADIKRSIWNRDGGQCTFIDPKSQGRCVAKHFIEEDHIVPKARGGEYSLKNIRLRCRAHNQRHAIDCFGSEKMREHIKSMNFSVN